MEVRDDVKKVSLTICAIIALIILVVFGGAILTLFIGAAIFALLIKIIEGKKKAIGLIIIIGIFFMHVILDSRMLIMRPQSRHWLVIGMTIIWLVIGVGLLLLKKRGLIASIIFLFFNLFDAIYAATCFNGFNWYNTSLALFSLISIIYLTRPSVKAQFK